MVAAAWRLLGILYNMHSRLSHPIGRSKHAHAQLYCAITTVQYGPVFYRSDMGKILLQQYQVYNKYVRTNSTPSSSFLHLSYFFHQASIILKHLCSSVSLQHRLSFCPASFPSRLEGMASWCSSAAKPLGYRSVEYLIASCIHVPLSKLSDFKWS